MSMGPIMNMTIEIQRRPVVDDGYGMGRRGDWATASTVLGWLDTNMKKETEVINNRDEANSDGICLVPADTDVLSTDRLYVTDLGLYYQVFGLPAAIVDPRDNSTHHVELRVRRYVG